MPLISHLKPNNYHHLKPNELGQKEEICGLLKWEREREAGRKVGGVESVKEGGDKENERTVMYVGHTACFFLYKKELDKTKGDKDKI